MDHMSTRLAKLRSESKSFIDLWREIRHQENQDLMLATPTLPWGIVIPLSFRLRSLRDPVYQILKRHSTSSRVKLAHYLEECHLSDSPRKNENCSKTSRSEKPKIRHWQLILLQTWLCLPVATVTRASRVKPLSCLSLSMLLHRVGSLIWLLNNHSWRSPTCIRAWQRRNSCAKYQLAT